jgi:hypothetical protein
MSINKKISNKVNYLVSWKVETIRGSISEIVLAIISQPSNITICEGLQASFSVTATGENLTYQWQTDTTGSWANLTDGGDISGATIRNLTIANIEAVDEANYRCIVSDDTDSVTSNTASLTVNISAAISSQPTAQSVDEGNTATFSLTATGTGLSYQWQSDASESWADLVDGGDISGANTNTLQIANVEQADEVNYRCIVTGTCSTVTSNSVALTINTVTVTFSENNSIEGATITCNGESQDTDVNGEAVFQLPANTTQSYTVSKGGYEQYSSSVVVQEANLTESFTLLVSPLEFVTTETGVFTGTVTMAVGGATVNYNA